MATDAKLKLLIDEALASMMKQTFVNGKVFTDLTLEEKRELYMTMLCDMAQQAFDKAAENNDVDKLVFMVIKTHEHEAGSSAHVEQIIARGDETVQ